MKEHHSRVDLGSETFFEYAFQMPATRTSMEKGPSGIGRLDLHELQRAVPSNEKEQ